MTTTKDMVWREVTIQRPYEVETLWDCLTHLASLTSRGPIIWEARARNGRMRYLLGTPRWSTSRVQEVFKAHTSVQFTTTGEPDPVDDARKLRISGAALPLNIDVTAAMIRATLAAMTGAKPDTEVVVQLVLGAAYAPSTVPKNPPDPAATWLHTVLGTAHGASSDQRRAMKDKALADIPIIAMTANAFKEDEQAAKDAGMQAHIAKPLDIPKMMRTLTEVLQNSDAPRSAEKS